MPKMALTTVAHGLESNLQQPSHMAPSGEVHRLSGDRTSEIVECRRGFRVSRRSAATGTDASRCFAKEMLLTAVLICNGELGRGISLGRGWLITLAILSEVGRREAEWEVPVKSRAFART